mgnify:CR=1 FL=1
MGYTTLPYKTFVIASVNEHNHNRSLSRYFVVFPKLMMIESNEGMNCNIQLLHGVG